MDKAYAKTPHFGAFFVSTACIDVLSLYHMAVQTRLFTKIIFSKIV